MQQSSALCVQAWIDDYFEQMEVAAKPKQDPDEDMLLDSDEDDFLLIMLRFPLAPDVEGAAIEQRFFGCEDLFQSNPSTWLWLDDHDFSQEQLKDILNPESHDFNDQLTRGFINLKPEVIEVQTHSDFDAEEISDLLNELLAEMIEPPTIERDNVTEFIETMTEEDWAEIDELLLEDPDLDVTDLDDANLDDPSDFGQQK